MTDVQFENFSYEAVVVAGVVYFLALLAYSANWAALRGVKAEERVEVGFAAMTGRLGLLLTGLAGLIHGVAVVTRGLAHDPNRVPWGNMYEFTLSATFFVTALFLVTAPKMRALWLGPWVVGFVWVTLMAGFLALDDAILPLPDALNSPWLVIHVVSAVLASAAFTIGGLLSVLYLIKERSKSTTGYLSRVPELATLDRISYWMHAFAFPVWTFAVLITGPIWAHQAWGAYWNWDPKEVWAFITWVVYAAYLHARATAGWKGRYAAYVALVGLLTLWFNFIGINFFSSSSQHSYAESAALVDPLERGVASAGVASEGGVAPQSSSV